jgi:hypothetical protein
MARAHFARILRRQLYGQRHHGFAYLDAPLFMIYRLRTQARPGNRNPICSAVDNCLAGLATERRGFALQQPMLACDVRAPALERSDRAILGKLQHDCRKTRRDPYLSPDLTRLCGNASALPVVQRFRWNNREALVNASAGFEIVHACKGLRVSVPLAALMLCTVAMTANGQARTGAGSIATERGAQGFS